MKPKNIVKEFYTTNAICKPNLLKKHLHPNITLEWYSSKGFLIMDSNDIHNIGTHLEKTYNAMRVEIMQLTSTKKKVSLLYKHYGNTIENPTEEILLATIMVIWKLKNNKLYKGYQVSQKY